MKQRIISAMLVVSCAISVHAAQNDWENENVIQINREPARAYFMPYAATPGDRHLSLNGTWQFRWAPTPEAIAQAQWTTIAVPANWEVNGFGTPIYSSSGYTFKVNPPYVMGTPKKGYTTETERNPTGHYRRTFTLPETWSTDGGQTYLRFDGVMSAFYVYI
ncbi:MAG: beta-galactosidase, partial [Prevotella sp.]|nr:beta-galactosidase [Prevotella sp.]